MPRLSALLRQSIIHPVSRLTLSCMLRILHLDDSDPDRELICRAMVAQGIKAEVHCAKSAEDFARILADVPVDLVLCDSGGTMFHGREALALVRQLQPEAV